MKSIKLKLGALLLALSLAVGLTVAVAAPASAATNVGYGFSTYTPFELYGSVAGGISASTGSGPVWYYESCVEWNDGGDWVNPDWTCSSSFLDSAPKVCGMEYRTRVIYTYYGYWNEDISPSTYIC